MEPPLILNIMIGMFLSITTLDPKNKLFNGQVNFFFYFLKKKVICTMDFNFSCFCFCSLYAINQTFLVKI